MAQDQRPHNRADAATRRDAFARWASEQLGGAAPGSPPEEPRTSLARARRLLRHPLAIPGAVILALALVSGGGATYARLAGQAPALVQHALRGDVRGYHAITLPTADAKPFDITRGADGNLWFTEFDGDKIGRVTAAGVVTEFAVPTPGAGPYMIAPGADGAIWFTEYYGGKIGRVAPDGVVTEYPLSGANASPTGIAAGPDGAIWVAAYPADIYRVVSNGVMTHFSLPQPSPVPLAITAGPDGALWFTYDSEFTSVDRDGDNQIGRITLAGEVSEFSLPTTFSNLDAITSGSGSAIWFADYANDVIGSITPSGAIHEYPANSPYNALNDLTTGPDSAIWFTRQDGMIGRMRANGAVMTYRIPTPHSQPDGLVSGPGGALWFTETGANAVGYVTLG